MLKKKFVFEIFALMTYKMLSSKKKKKKRAGTRAT